MTGAERAPAPPFDRAECIRHSLQDFTPHILPLGGLDSDVEERYLAGQVWYEEDGNLRHPLVDMVVDIELQELGDPGETLTDEQLAHIAVVSEQRQRAFGPNIVAAARALRLEQALSPNALTSLIADGRSVLARMESEWGRDPGWQVAASQETSVPHLLVPAPTQTRGPLYSVVNLEEYANVASDALIQEIIQYHRAQVMARLSNILRLNVANHHTPSDTILPGYMRELAAQADPDQRQRYIDQALYLMQWIAWLPQSGVVIYPNLVYDMQRQLRNAAVPGPEGEKLRVGHYLQHRETCPSETAEAREEAAWLNAIAQGIQAIDIHGRRPADEPLHLLANLASYALLTEPSPEAEAEQAAREDRRRQMAAIAREAVAAVGPEAAMAPAETRLPGAAAALAQFREVVEARRYVGPGGWDRLLDALGMRLYLRMENEPCTLHSARAIIVEAWQRNAGITPGELQTQIAGNLDLDLLLHLLIIKTAQAKTRLYCKGPETTQRYDALLEELAQGHERGAAASQVYRQQLAAQRLEWAAFRERYNITDEDLAAISELLMHDPGGRPILTRAYTAMFNALYLMKHRMLSTDNLGAREILKRLVRVGSETDALVAQSIDRAWQRLQSLGL